MAAMTYLDVFREAMALSERERAELAAELMASVDVAVDATHSDAVEQAWILEIERRIRAHDADPTKAVSYDEFVARSEQALR